MKMNFTKKVLSVFLCITLIMTYLPISVMAASASSDRIDRVADPSTMDSWRDFFLPDGKISTESAGGVWMDKSVFTNDNEFNDTGITLDNSNAFLVALSAMASNMTVTGMSHVPTDTMLVLDVSASMGPGRNNVASELVEAANESIASLLTTNSHNRVGVVLYSGPETTGGSATATDAVLVLPLGRYETENDVYLNYQDNKVSLNREVVYEGTINTKPSTTSKSVSGGTYIQKGVMLAANQLTADELDTTLNDAVLGTIQRKPVMVLMSDGAPTFSSTNFQDPTTINLGSGNTTSAAQGFVNQLTASYAKGLVEEKYGTDALFYTIGLGVSNEAVAISVLDPNNRNASTAINNFWTQWNDTAVGRTVTVQSATYFPYSPAKTVTKINGLDKNYVDEYINVDNDNSNISLGDRLKEAFADIVGKINLQSKYTPTLITQVGDDHSGFISFVDKIGEHMQVTDIKGILINDTLYSGADLASNFVSGGGNLGTYDNPTALGHEMVAAVRQRIGLASDDEARTLIGLAYEYGQIRFTNANNYSNYIGWYADEDSNFLGFYHDGVTNITDSDAVYTIKSYGYLGVEHDSNMMYATVQVRHNIKTGEETVAFAVPASLIPVMTYNVTLDGDGKLSDIELSGAESPIRLVYEVALDSHINEWNVKEVVSAEYFTNDQGGVDEHNVNDDGSINFYTNAWEHTNNTGYNTVNTYSYFNPSRQNEKYYYTEDAPVYTDNQGTLYAGSTKPDSKGIFYRAYTVYEKDGSALSKKTIYRQLSEAALETAEPTDGTNNYHIPNGNVHVNLDGYTIGKDPNNTDTLGVAYQPFVDVYGHNVNDVNHTFYVGATLGNNGKLTLKPQTGIKLSKKMAEGVADSGEAFVFDIFNTTDVNDGSIYPALLVEADGTERNIDVYFDDGNTSVELKAGEVLYIGDMTHGETFRIVERETAEYIATSTGLSENGTVTVNQNELIPVSFINADRGTGNLTVSKIITHPFGANYEIPKNENTLFEITVDLDGLGTNNATFTATHNSDNTIKSVKTDAEGKFVTTLSHNDQLTLNGLPVGTVAKVVETKYGTGFEPVYWNNGVKTENTYGEVIVVRNNTVSVIVENAYTPANAAPVNLKLGGTKYINNSNGSSIENWDDDYEFEIVLQRFDTEEKKWVDVDSKEIDKDNQTFTFNMSSEIYSEPGVYSYQVFEVEPELDSSDRVSGIVYDNVWHTFSVYVNDTNMDGMLEIERVHSDHTNEDFELVNGIYTITTNFTNIQSIEIPALATIDIQKELVNETGSNRVNLAGYSFELYTDAECTTPATDIDEELKIDRNPTDAVGEGWIDIVLYKTTEANAPYVFYLKEKEGLENGMHYDHTVVKVEISVENSATVNGALVAEVEYFDLQGNALAESAYSDEDELIFTNEYTVKGTDLFIDFVSKKLSGRAMEAGEFTFVVKDLDGKVMAEGANSSAAASDESVKVTFDKPLPFTKAGTYFYNIVETSTDGNGITTDKTTYRVTVNVTDVDGQLVANYSIVNVVGDSIVFTNTYDAADTSYAISGTKKLEGRALLNDEFTFVLTEAQNAQGDIAEGAKTYEAHNEFGGKFTFPEITYTKAGTYYYVVSEKQNGGSNYGIVYDTTKYVVTVTVTDDVANGKLVASANLGTANIEFENKYIANPVSKSIDGEKVLYGKTLVLGQFKFELWESNSDWAKLNAEPIQTVANDGEGNFAFNFVDYDNDNATDFTKVGSYYYLINEVNGGQTIKGITYDSIVYRVRVDITDDLLGQLHATVNIFDNAGVPQESILFENNYEITGNSDITISGTKKLNGIVPESREFEFELYKANADYEINGNYIQKVTQDENGNFEFKITYKPEDISDTPYYYVAKEVNGGQRINGVTYDNTEYHIEVKVEDDDEGGVKSTAIIRKGESVVTSLDFANTYKATSATVSIIGTKRLENRALKENEFKFFLYPADKDYVIDEEVTPKEAKNNADGSFAFDTLSFDKIGTYYFIISEDTNTTAENVTNDISVYRLAIEIKDDGKGKLYEDSRVTKKVGSDDEVKEIVFNNVYTPTPKPDTKPETKPDTKSEADYPESPKTGDNTNIHLWFALLFVSGGGIFGTAFYGRKRKEKQN